MLFKSMRVSSDQMFSVLGISVCCASSCGSQLTMFSVLGITGCCPGPCESQLIKRLERRECQCIVRAHVDFK